MSQPTSSQALRIKEFIHRHAPFSIIDKGLTFANRGHVYETVRIGGRIQGIVRGEEGDQSSYTVALDVLSPYSIDAVCTCCHPDEMEEQWCPHAVALLWRANELGFFESRGGFPATESTYRVVASTPQEIADVLRGLDDVGAHPPEPTSVSPAVRIVLDHDSDRLGVRVLFDGISQQPVLFEGFQTSSTRALDNILLRILDEEGSWDDSSAMWYVNSSDGIEVVLGLLQEYGDVSSATTEAPIKFSNERIKARVTLKWDEFGADLILSWILPDGTERSKEGELFGTGPYWTVVHGTVHRLSAEAAKLASIFSRGSTISLPRHQLAPVLEMLTSGDDARSSIRIVNEHLQPGARVAEPTPVLTVEIRKGTLEDDVKSGAVELFGYLDFEYPPGDASQNEILLPNRVKEEEYAKELSEKGFQSLGTKRRFVSRGDAALDVIHDGQRQFVTPWRVVGLEAARSAVRFADLEVSVKVTSGDPADDIELPMTGGGWFDCHIALTQNKANIPISTLFKNARSDSDRWTRLDTGAFARVPGGSLAHLKSTLGMLDPGFRLSNTIRTKLSAAQAIGLSRMEDPLFRLNIDQRVTDLSNRLANFSSINPMRASKNFRGKLRPYQEDGISWLSFLSQFELGGILADEMGLGKTVQTLCFLQTTRDAGGWPKRNGKPVLVVTPTSVMMNWVYETKRFTPSFKVLLLHGPQRKATFSTIPKHDIVVTSYALLRLDRYELERHEFAWVFLDEAQNIKNYQAATTRAAKALRTTRRVALTGTPTENRPMELWSIFDFLMPGYLGSHEFFRSTVERPILEGGPGVEIAKVLNSKTRPFILRRLKSDVEKELPPKIESVLHVDMAPSQRQLYFQVLEEVRPRVIEAVEKRGVRGASVSILAALLRLRQICNHPNSLDPLSEVEGFESGKFSLFQDLVSEAVESGRKILVFGQFRAMLEIMRRWVDEQGYGYVYLDGATKNRQEVIDKFNTDTSVRLFLMSLKAGGTGLNLTAADTVIIYDPWWNPAVEEQAIDRAHRIGQSRTVTVYRLVTENSVEQKIMELKQKKSKIVDALINENGLSTINLSRDDIESLFSPISPE